MNTYYSMTVSFSNSVKTMNEINYEDWKESLDLYRAIANLDLTMRTEIPVAISDTTIEAHMILYEK